MAAVRVNIGRATSLQNHVISTSEARRDLTRQLVATKRRYEFLPSVEMTFSLRMVATRPPYAMCSIAMI